MVLASGCPSCLSRQRQRSWNWSQLSLSCTARVRVRATATSRLSTSMSMNPGNALPDSAAFTAPHDVWPSTMITLTPSSSTAYSSDAISSGDAMLPAMRHTNTSPKPWSNRISVGTRESAHPRMAAMGFCLGWIFWRRSNVWWGWDDWPRMKRMLPSISSCSASSGEPDSRSPVGRRMMDCPLNSTLLRLDLLSRDARLLLLVPTGGLDAS
mmetsp:Transcript_4080/g.10210  ORF Transcript_4080/g.10210 Transcript_4080/m.10210 type:complete len:211 (+) Transcript_4080:686-1318(+)